MTTKSEGGDETEARGTKPATGHRDQLPIDMSSGYFTVRHKFHGNHETEAPRWKINQKHHRANKIKDIRKAFNHGNQQKNH